MDEDKAAEMISRQELTPARSSRSDRSLPTDDQVLLMCVSGGSMSVSCQLIPRHRCELWSHTSSGNPSSRIQPVREVLVGA